MPIALISASVRYNADAPGERLRYDELALGDLQRQRGQGPCRGPAHDGSAFARIVVRVVAGAFEDLLLGLPAANFAAGVRANRRIGYDAFGRAILGRPNE